MRVSELSRQTGVSVATIKYYLREGLLHAGERTSANQARYDETHAARLRLIRALIGVADLSVATTREVLASLDDPPATPHDLFSQAHRTLLPEVADVDTVAADALISDLGWRLGETDRGSVRRLAVAMAAAESAGFPLHRDGLVNYARSMEALANRELAEVPADPAEAVRYVVLGTVLLEPVLLALRRLAQIDASARRYRG